MAELKNTKKTGTQANGANGSTSGKPSIVSNSVPKIFGTDGIRGTANKYPMTAEMALRVGQAVGYILQQKPKKRPGEKKTVLIGKDTRLSGYMIEQALSSGLNSMGVFVHLTGPLPTPGIGFLAQNMRVDAGVVISASHNAYMDNGIKIFGADGFKLTESMEREIERLVFTENLDSLCVESNLIGRTKRIDDAAGRYIVYAKNAFPLDLTLDGLRIVLDCANGAAYKVAPAIFQELGAEVIVLGDEPNGTNINDKAGALFPKRVADAVLEYRADLGITLDGDADRVILVDEQGRIVNGDHILAICAVHLAKQNKLSKNTVVATEMSNIGLNIALKPYNIDVVRTDVGDKYVVDEMRKNGYVLGGEQSGHIIFLNHSTTGDGCVAALSVLAVMQREGKKLSELNEIMTDAPQVLVNTRVTAKPELEGIKGYNELISEISAKLNGQGRLYVRYSGTEPVIRVLVEGKNKKEITQYAEQISRFLETKIGD